MARKDDEAGGLAVQTMDRAPIGTADGFDLRESFGDEMGQCEIRSSSKGLRRNPFGFFDDHEIRVLKNDTHRHRYQFPIWLMMRLLRA